MCPVATGTVKLYFLESEDFKESIKIGHFVAERRGMVKKRTSSPNLWVQMKNFHFPGLRHVVFLVKSRPKDL